MTWSPRKFIFTSATTRKFFMTIFTVIVFAIALLGASSYQASLSGTAERTAIDIDRRIK